MTRRPALDAGVAGGMLVWKLRELGDWAVYVVAYAVTALVDYLRAWATGAV